LESAFAHALAHLESLETCPIGPRVGLATLRARLDRPLGDEGDESVHVIDDLAADVEGGLNISASGRFFAW
jgi:hypothetical protein